MDSDKEAEVKDNPEENSEKSEEETNEPEIIVQTGPPPKKLTFSDLVAQERTRYLGIAIIILVLVVYTVPLLFFATFSAISFFYYIYPAALLGGSIFVFKKILKVKPRLGIEIATILVSLATFLFTAIYLLISFSFAGHL